MYSKSTHNFISEDIAKKVELQAKVEEQFKVVVALGKKFPSRGKCINVKLLLQEIFPFLLIFIFFHWKDMIKC